MKVHEGNLHLEFGINFFPPFTRDIIIITGLLIREMKLNLLSLYLELFLNQMLDQILHWFKLFIIVLNHQFWIKAVWRKIKFVILRSKNLQYFYKKVITF
jgi:hypothetical protein